MAEERKGGKDSDKELDDWAAAIDEWDANLALPSAEAQKREAKPTPPPVPAPPLPSRGEAQRNAIPTPSTGITVKSDPALTPLPPPPGNSLPDPLMQLFDGEMELPEEAGQALGSLLGVDQPQTMVAPEGSIAKLLEDDAASDEPGLYEENAGSTRVASADEFDKLLADTAAVV